jgi:hypothetical protein
MDALDTFAAERDSLLTVWADLLRPEVADALGGDWGDVLALAREAYDDVLDAEGGTPGGWGAHERELRATLAKTTEPHDEAQVDRISLWLATYIVNAATLDAAPAGATKTWVTMRDDDVRELHVPLHGETLAVAERFSVGTADLRFPGEPVGPPEGWINCRCVLSVTAPSLVAGGHDLIFLEGRRTPKVVSRGARYTPKRSEGRIVKRRKANADEERAIARGDWVRVNRDGKKPGQPGYMERRSRVRPQHNGGEVTTMAEADVLDEVVVDDAATGDEMWHDDAVRVEPLECHGVLAPEGIPSGDGRMFSVDALSWRDLPIPLMYQPANLPGHDGSVVVGQISRIWREGPLVRWAGRFADTAAADEVAGLIGEEHLRGISVDVDSAELAVDGAEGDNPLTEFSKGRISAATICAIPAFAEAYIALGPGPVDVEDQGAPSFQGEPPVVEDALVASESTDDFGRGPGWVTDPAPTARIHHYWTKGEGAAKIRWGTPGDFTRCTRQLRKYVGPQYLNRTCAQWHHDALGYWPGQKGMPGNPPLSGETTEAACDDCETTALVASVTLTRDARPVLDGAWFTDPGLTGPTPVTVTEDGRVFGHLATWGTCHIGIQDACVTPPQSKAAYGYFRTGVVLTTDGEVPVGSLTMDTGHAPLSYRARPAAAHYDNTGAVVADVAVGEDAYGIWVAGAMRPNLDADQVARFRASALSGDWRAIAGNLELVGALAVNVPGYPIPRPALAASAADGQTALVAAGVVTPDQHRMRVAALLTEQKKMRAEALLTEMGV